MAADKKQRLVPGSMYIPPTPPVTTPASTVSPAASSTPNPASSASTTTAAAPTSAATKSSKASAAASSSSTPASASAVTQSATTKALTPNKPLSELLRSIEPRFCFQPAVEELLLDMASDFVDDVVSFSSRLAKHRRSTVLEAKDLQFCLAKNYGVSLAGAMGSSTSSSTAGADSAAVLNPLGSDVLVRSRPGKNSLHMHRMALKRKTLQRTAVKLKKHAAGGVKAGGSDAAKKVVHRKSSTGALSDLK